jgi:hypothetical protein
MRAGVTGLLRDKTRRSRIPPPASVRDRTVALTQGEPPGEATHWTAALMVNRCRRCSKRSANRKRPARAPL